MRLSVLLCGSLWEKIKIPLYLAHTHEESLSLLRCADLFKW
jgi:hypothetical protein